MLQSGIPNPPFTIRHPQSPIRYPTSNITMHFPIFQLINFSIILIVLIFLIKYIWDMFFGENYEPPAWKLARKEGKLNHDLLKAARNYPDKIRLYNFWLQIQRIEKARF